MTTREDSAGNEIDAQASDFEWYFQDWPHNRTRQKRRGNRRQIPDSGNALSRVTVTGDRGTNGFEYVREERLSSLGRDRDTARLVAHNIGRKNATGNMLSSLREKSLDGGLNRRVRTFSLLDLLAGGDNGLEGISADDAKTMFAKATGLEEDQLEKLADVEKYQQLIEDHIEELANELAKSLADTVPGLDRDHVMAIYERILEAQEALAANQGRVDELTDEVTEYLLENATGSMDNECF